MAFKSFRFFTESAKSRLLWRYIVRTAYKAPPQERADLLAWARSDFNQHLNETDPDKIRFLVGEGIKRAREMDRLLEISKNA